MNSVHLDVNFPGSQVASFWVDLIDSVFLVCGSPSPVSVTNARAVRYISHRHNMPGQLSVLAWVSGENGDHPIPSGYCLPNINRLRLESHLKAAWLCHKLWIFTRRYGVRHYTISVGGDARGDDEYKLYLSDNGNRNGKNNDNISSTPHVFVSFWWPTKIEGGTTNLCVLNELQLQQLQVLVVLQNVDNTVSMYSIQSPLW